MDPIANMFTIIRNAQAVKKETARVPYSTVTFQLARILVDEGFLAGVEQKEKKGKASMVLTLQYGSREEGAIRQIERVSTPGQRIYVKAGDLRKVKNGFGRALVSTSQGIMSGEEAKKKGLGGEYMGRVW